MNVRNKQHAGSPARKSKALGVAKQAASKNNEGVLAIPRRREMEEMPGMSAEDEATLRGFAAIVEENTLGRPLNQCLDLVHLAELAGVDFQALHRDSTLFIAMWVTWLQITEQCTAASELKYTEMDQFVATYPVFASKSDSEKSVLMRTANWMHFLFSKIPARKNKGLALLVVPKLVEGWQARYVTGSGQTKPTADRVRIYETEGGVEALGKPRSVGRNKKIKKDLSANSKRKQTAVSVPAVPSTLKRKGNVKNEGTSSHNESSLSGIEPDVVGKKDRAHELKSVDLPQPQAPDDSLYDVSSKRVKTAHVPLYDTFGMSTPNMKRGRDTCLNDFLSELDVSCDGHRQEIVSCDGIQDAVDLGMSGGDDGHFYENDTSSESAVEDDSPPHPLLDVTDLNNDRVIFSEPVKKKMEPAHTNRNHHSVQTFVTQMKPGCADFGTGMTSYPSRPFLLEPLRPYTQPSQESSVASPTRNPKGLSAESTPFSTPRSAVTNTGQDPVSVSSPLPSPLHLPRVFSWDHMEFDLDINPLPVPETVMDAETLVGIRSGGELLDAWQVPGFPSGTTNMLFPSELTDDADPFQFFL